MSVVLGFSNTHNGGVALICDGEVRVAIQAERLSRIKRKSLPLNQEKELAKQCVSYCLEVAGLKHADVQSIGLCTPWSVEKISEPDLYDYIGGIPANYKKTFYVPHHLAHMEYIIHFGNNEPGIVLVIDGSGSLEEDRKCFNIKEKRHPDIVDHAHFSGKEVISAYWFDGYESSLIYRFSPSIAPLESYNQFSDGLYQSLGHYWEWASLYCCGSRHDAGKVMGLASFGDSELVKTKDQNILSIDSNGRLQLDYATLKTKYREPNVFGFDLSNSTHHQNVAYEVQFNTEQVILKLLEMLKTKHPTETLYLSGGVALNVVANEKIIRSNLFNNVILNGSVEDNGTAIGAGLAAALDLGQARKTSPVTDYYGKLYTEEEMLEAIRKYDFPHKILPEQKLFRHVAALIAENFVVGWFQGRSEFGPRALGNRSILANPTSPKTKYVLDLYMKCRDRYRPYAPVTTEERVGEYFDIKDTSPVMMRSANVLGNQFPAVTHIDGSARVQTVNKNQNKRLHSLLLELEKCTGYPVVLNTSFNLPGEPIVEAPSDALSCFARGGLDYLCLGNILIWR